jgi:periplasmic copper chaperone A
MRTCNLFKGSLAFSLGVALALAAQHASALLTVNQPWARPAQRGQSTEVYMDITSSEGAILVAATSDAAITSAIRAPGKASGKIIRVPLPAGTLVALAPGGYRIGLNGVIRPLKLGDKLKLTLSIEAADGSRQDVSVNAEVRLRSPLEDERRAHQHAH